MTLKVGEILSFRNARGWSQTDLARELSAVLESMATKGLSSRTSITGAALGKYERGQNQPRSDIQNALRQLSEKYPAPFDDDHLSQSKDEQMGSGFDRRVSRSDWRNYCGGFCVFRRSYDEKNLLIAKLKIEDAVGNGHALSFVLQQKSATGSEYEMRGSAICDDRRLVLIGFRPSTSIPEVLIFPLPDVGVGYRFLHGLALTSTFPGLPYCARVVLQKSGGTHSIENIPLVDLSRSGDQDVLHPSLVPEVLDQFLLEHEAFCLKV